MHKWAKWGSNEQLEINYMMQKSWVFFQAFREEHSLYVQPELCFLVVIAESSAKLRFHS